MKTEYYTDWMARDLLKSITEDDARVIYESKNNLIVQASTCSDDYVPVISFTKKAIFIYFVSDLLSLDFCFQFIDDAEDIQSGKAFLVRLLVKEKDKKGEVVKMTTYHPVLLKGGKWEIQHHVFCEEIDYIKNETCNYYTENKVDVNSLYKEMPTFGEWEKLIEDTKMRFLDE